MNLGSDQLRKRSAYIGFLVLQHTQGRIRPSGTDKIVYTNNCISSLELYSWPILQSISPSKNDKTLKTEDSKWNRENSFMTKRKANKWLALNLLSPL